MTYGVDQCRVCGTPIPIRGPDILADQERVNRKPIIPEEEWRQLGLLTSPTREQLYRNPANGCCGPCGLKLMRRHYNYTKRAMAVIGLAVGLAVIIVGVITYLPH